MSIQDFLPTTVGKHAIPESAYRCDTFSESVMDFPYSSILPPHRRQGGLVTVTSSTNRIEQLNGGRFISRHRSGVEIYYDSRHKITKVKCEGGVIMELVQEYRQHTATLRNPIMSISNHGIVSLKTEGL